MSDIREDLPEAEYYHSALTWFDEERDEPEFSPNKTRAVRPCLPGRFMSRHGEAFQSHLQVYIRADTRLAPR
jgi:hypothetical protein